MSDSWWVIVMPLIVSILALVVPGIAVLAAGWGVRRLRVLALAPVVSIAILAVAATAAPLVGLSWSVLPIAIVTVVAAAAAFALRRWVGSEPDDRTPGRTVLWGGLSLLAAAVVIALQLAWVFGGPANISQTFDAIVHLNTVAFAVDTGDVSAFHIGLTSDIGFYPNGWHTVAALAAQATGASVPVAVNAANIALAAVAWPLSVVALSTVLLSERTAVVVSAAALSTGFGAFPLLLMYFGVLYPNAMGYAVLPGGVAVVVHLLRATGTAARVRAAVLLLVAAAGVGLAHPNAFLSMAALGAGIAVVELLGRAVRHPSRRRWMSTTAILLGLFVVLGVLWRVMRTNAEMSIWAPWQTTARAVGEALLLSPGGYTITVTISVMIAVGIFAIVRRPRLLVVAAPMTVATVLFVVASGTAGGNALREFLTNPWYNDSYRLAALLPAAGIPVAVLGAVTIADAVARALTRARAGRVLRVAVAAVGVLAVFSVGVSPNILRTAADARGAYALNATSPLLTNDEEALLERLPETTPADAVIAGSPWTGASLAYAVGDREVLRKHVFGTIGPDEEFLDSSFRQIETNPRVCEVVDRLGVDYVLDFGAQNVWNNPGVGLERQGLYNLSPSEHLVLVDSEGPSARLFKIEGADVSRGTSIAVAYDCLFPFTTGGGERQYRAQAVELGLKGFEVDYLTAVQWDGPVPHEEGFRIVPVTGRLSMYAADGVRRVPAAVRFAWGLFAALVRRRRRYAAVIVSGLPVFNVFAARLALLGSGTKLVVDYLEVWHRRQWVEYSGAVMGTIAWVLQRAAIAITPLATCHSQLSATRLKREGLRRAPQVSPGLIDGAVEVPAPSPAAAPPYVLYVGRHIPDKRVEVLPAAVAAARESIPDLELVLLGTGPSTDAIRAEVRRVGGEEWTRFPGFVSDAELDDLLHGASCLANPSRREGYGLVVVEANAHGVPVVLVADEGNAATELVDDGVNGVVSPTTSPADLARAIRAAVDGGDDLRRSSRAWYDAAVGTRTIRRTVEGILSALPLPTPAPVKTKEDSP